MTVYLINKFLLNCILVFTQYPKKTVNFYVRRLTDWI